MKEQTKTRLANAFGSVALMVTGFAAMALSDLMLNWDHYALRVKLDKERQAAVSPAASAPALTKR